MKNLANQSALNDTNYAYRMAVIKEKIATFKELESYCADKQTELIAEMDALIEDFYNNSL